MTKIEFARQALEHTWRRLKRLGLTTDAIDRALKELANGEGRAGGDCKKPRATADGPRPNTDKEKEMPKVRQDV